MSLLHDVRFGLASGMEDGWYVMEEVGRRVIHSRCYGSGERGEWEDDFRIKSRMGMSDRKGGCSP
jgi:hypothetical protein